MKELSHLHLLIKGKIKNPPTSTAYVENWLKELVADIDMKICIPPQARYVDIEGNRGMTALVAIETSHIAIHIWDEVEPALVQMDVYSCAYFDPEIVTNKLNEFGLLYYQKMVIDRNKELRVIE
jgi:S-adenosylmethionine/arginine decarboxylase-like enzyme